MKKDLKNINNSNTEAKSHFINEAADGALPTVLGDEPDQPSLLDLFEKADRPTALELIRLSANEQAALLFTGNYSEITVHFCDEAEIKGYAHCLGEACLLCKAGKKQEHKYLLPVAVPTERRVAVMMIGTSMRPRSLLCEMGQHIKAAILTGPQIVFISRDGTLFQVTGRSLSNGEDNCAAQIQEFLARVKSGTVDLRQAVQSLTNEQILAVPGIRQMLALKGEIGR